MEDYLYVETRSQLVWIMRITARSEIQMNLAITQENEKIKSDKPSVKEKLK